MKTRVTPLFLALVLSSIEGIIQHAHGSMQQQQRGTNQSYQGQPFSFNQSYQGQPFSFMNQSNQNMYQNAQFLQNQNANQNQQFINTGTNIIPEFRSINESYTNLMKKFTDKIFNMVNQLYDKKEMDENQIMQREDAYVKEHEGDFNQMYDENLAHYEELKKKYPQFNDAASYIPQKKYFGLTYYQKKLMKLNDDDPRYKYYLNKFSEELEKLPKDSEDYKILSDWYETAAREYDSQKKREQVKKILNKESPEEKAAYKDLLKKWEGVKPRTMSEFLQDILGNEYGQYANINNYADYQKLFDRVFNQEELKEDYYQDANHTYSSTRSDAIHDKLNDDLKKRFEKDSTSYAYAFPFLRKLLIIKEMFDSKDGKYNPPVMNPMQEWIDVEKEKRAINTMDLWEKKIQSVVQKHVEDPQKK